MSIPLSLKKTGHLLLAATLMGAQIAPVQAAMIGTAQAIAAEQGNPDRGRLMSLLEREDLQRQLAAHGVDVQDAKARVAGLTNAEAARLNQRLDQLPAGGDGVLGAILLIFIIFVITDALGATDVFPFVHPIK